MSPQDARAEILQVASRIAAGCSAYYGECASKACVEAAVDLIAEVDKHVDERTRMKAEANWEGGVPRFVDVTTYLFPFEKK